MINPDIAEFDIDESLNPDIAEIMKQLIGQSQNERYKIERFLNHHSFGFVFLVNDEMQNNEK